MTQERGYGEKGQTRFLPKEAPGRYGTGRPGFTLLELLIAMVVGLVVLGAVYAVFTVQNTQLGNQEIATEMQQNARIAMEMMTREIGLAGYRDVTLTMTDANCSGSGGALPKCTGTTPWGSGYCLGIMTAAADAIKFTLDITNSAGANNTPDGTVCNANEFVTYELYTPSGGVQCLGRKSSVTATRQQVVENVEALGFTYYNSAGTALTQPVALDAIANVKVTIRVKAAKADPTYTHPTYGDHYRRYDLTSLAVPRNLIGLYGGAASTVGTTSTTGTSSSTTSSTTTTAASSSTTTVASTVLTTSTTVATTTTVPTTSTTTAGAAPISNVTRTPSGATVAKNTSVTVCATIVGSYATRKLKTNQGDNLTMTLSSGSIYCGTIPKHNNQTVTYWIELTDSLGNVTTGDIYSYDQEG